MNNSSRVLSILAALAMVFFITGCGSSDEATTEEAKQVEAVEVVEAEVVEAEVVEAETPEATESMDAASKSQQFDALCGADVEKYCPQVLPGDGRIAACLYAHTDLLEDGCYDVTERVGVVLEGLFDALEDFFSACQVDLELYCPDAKAGTGEQVSCLRENSGNISSGCNAALPGSASQI